MRPDDLDPNLPKVGETVRDKYRLVGVIGQGGVGVVFEAEHLRMRQRVAIKFLLPWMVSIPGTVPRFEREARAMGRLHGPNITRVLDVDTTEKGIPYMVMEFLEGHDLNGELRARRALPLGEAVMIIRQACLGMAEAHAAGVVHRDLKPSNLFLAQSGGERVVKVLDFGISKINDDEIDVTMTETTLGTPSYMSPEQVRSAKHVDHRSDIWSLGVILYRMLTGKLPFSGASATGMAVAIVTEDPTPVRTFRPDLPEGVVATLEKALAKQVDKRYSTVEELSEALAPFTSDAREVVLANDDAADPSGPVGLGSAHGSSVTGGQTGPGDAPTFLSHILSSRAISKSARQAEARRARHAIASVAAVIALVGGGAGFFAWRAFGARAHPTGVAAASSAGVTSSTLLPVASVMVPESPSAGATPPEVPSATEPVLVVHEAHEHVVHARPLPPPPQRTPENAPPANDNRPGRFGGMPSHLLCDDLRPCAEHLRS